MPDLHDAGVSDGRTAPGTEAGEVSRRSVLRGAFGAGAAGIALAGAGFPAAASASTTAPAARRQRADTGSSAGPAEPVVVYVRDAAAGEIDVFRGTTCTRLHDRGLAAELVRASK
jgi:hypothetical protein